MAPKQKGIKETMQQEMQGKKMPMAPMKMMKGKGKGKQKVAMPN